MSACLCFRLSEITQSLQGMSIEDGSVKFKDWVARLEARLEKERAQVMESAAKGSSGRSKTGGGAEWSPADLQLLIKAVNLFPAGTNQRYVHSGCHLYACIGIGRRNRHRCTMFNR